MLTRFINWLTISLFSTREERKTHSLTRKALFLFPVLSILLIFTVSYFLIGRNLTAMVIQRRELTAHLAAIALEGRLNHFVEIGISLADRVRLRELIGKGEWDEAMTTLRRFPQDFSSLDRLFLTDSQGTLMADTPALPDVVGKNFAYRDWYQGVSRQWQPTVSPVYRRLAEPAYHVVAVAVPVKNEEGEVLAVLVLQIKVDLFHQWTKESSPEFPGIVFFVDQRGQLVAHPHYSPQERIVDFSTVPSVQKVLKGEDGVAVGYNPVEKATSLSAFRYIPRYGWGVITEEPVGTAFAIRDHTLRLLAGICGFILFLNFLLVGFIAKTFDILQRHRQGLQEGQQRLNTILETAQDAIISADRQGRIIGWNRAARQIFGYPAVEAIGQPLTLIMPEQYRRNHREAFTHYLETGKANVIGNTLELSGLKKDGQEFPLEISISTWTVGEDRFFTAIIRDITQRKTAEDKIREAARIKSNFVSLVSHEVRTPLTVIKGGVDALNDQLVGPINPEQQDLLNAVKRHIDRLAHLINDVLDYQKLESGRMHFEMREHDMRDLIRHTLADLLSTAKNKGLTLAADLPSVPLTVICDKDKMIHVLINLVHNAVKFSDHGTITVKAEATGNHQARVAVMDEGVGIRKEDHSKLFQTFSRIPGDRTTSGSGLGLFIVKEIIKQHNGEVFLNSVYGQGTTVGFLLPLKS